MDNIEYPEHAMKPTYHAESRQNLPPTVVKSEVLHAIESTWGELRYATAENIRIAVDWNNPASTRIRSAYDLLPQGYQSTATLEKTNDTRVTTCTQENPAILLEHRASFCTLLLAFDSYGNAALLHQPMYGEAGDPQDDADLDAKIQNFKDESYKIVNMQGMTLVTGTNSLDGNTEQHRRVLQAVVNKMAPDKIEPLFIQAKESAYKGTSRWEDISRKAKDTVSPYLVKDSPLPTNIRDISGIIFIPSELSSNKKNIIMVIDKETDMRELQDVLFPPVPQSFAA